MTATDQNRYGRSTDMDERSHRVFELIALSSHLSELRRASELFHYNVNELIGLSESELRGRIGGLLALWSACQESLHRVKGWTDDADYLRDSWHGRDKVKQLVGRIGEVYRFSNEVQASLTHSSLDNLLALRDRFRNGLLALDTLHQALIHREARELTNMTARLRNSAKDTSPGRDIFLVHGHDTAAREEIARFLEGIDTTVRILHEMPNAGRTIIEKFEDYSDAGYAVALLTADDVAHAKQTPEISFSRARQNVVFELGYFIGKLGRGRVCALVQDGVERPSDIDGLVYIALDKAGGWKMALAKDIKNAGINVNLNKLIEGNP